ncbi:MAG TPA: hypothetical protein VF522_10710 [Ramlibacter sp.]|uniref:hypothetical protein n=1 Tax=Ramlibacter sp. TaxID=1917967 RepID=UPI002ED304AC
MQYPTSFLLAAALLAPAGSAGAAPLAPSSGHLAVEGRLDPGGRYAIEATLKDGNFTGTMTVTLGGQTLSAPLMERRSHLENGRCYFRAEQGRARAELAGKCDSTGFEGTFNTFLPGPGSATGKQQGRVALSGGGQKTVAAGTLPAAKLTCAYQDRKVSFKWGEATQYSLAFSNLGTLALSGHRYATAKSAGSFERVGADKIRLTSGPWAGAVGTLEPDRSGRPAVVFHIEENRRPDGVHIVDPYTTRCTEARS